MSTREAELVIETWRLRERDLPRVPPAGWGTVDRLRAAVCLAVECAVDGVDRIEPFEGPASERERFAATVTTDAVDDALVSVRPAPAEGETDDETEARGDGESFEETTKQFDLDEALDRL
ncbi:hypothetical protein [Halorubrum tropicale]|uniref:Uncharacterized protein n=1 Tax=Halorubrum tropicale TaxID=1765655 RepID=A0A0M9AQ00_9EURY|nr:hypothetical protein [Halorubrum tropicale]KOX95988.1 hypothetical protein AMR74_10585 [Halorubrum tropicale]